VKTDVLTDFHHKQCIFGQKTQKIKNLNAPKISNHFLLQLGKFSCF